MALALWTSLVLAGCGGQEAAGPAADEQGGAATAAPGDTTFARKLGGAGDERAVGLAVGADGSVFAASAIGGGEQSAPRDLYLRWTRPASLGLTKLDAAGRTIWARQAPVSAADVAVAGVARSPLGNVFLALRVEGGGTVDLGGGPVRGNVLVKLAPDGRFVWQRDVERPVTSLAVDGVGSAAVGATQPDGPNRVLKYRWDGALLWDVPLLGPEPRNPDARPAVAFDPAGFVVAGDGIRVWKLHPEGGTAWSFALPTGAFSARIAQVGTTAKGTVVVRGDFFDEIVIGADRIVAGGPAWPELVLALEADGRPRWLRQRSGHGPMAIDPEGRIAFVDWPLDIEDLTAEWTRAVCRDVVKWDLTGAELWRRPLATCGPDHVGRVLQGGVAIAPDHGIWVQGEARDPFDVGTGTLTPRGSDWFVVRVAP